MFSSLLEQANPELETINLGVSGYSTDQELLLYINEGSKFEVDTVLLVVAYNDFPLNLQDRAYLIYGKPYYEIQGGKLVLRNQPVPETPFLKRTLVSIGRQSFLLSQLHRSLWSTGL